MFLREGIILREVAQIHSLYTIINKEQCIVRSDKDKEKGLCTL
jgi:hypothetical protein